MVLSPLPVSTSPRLELAGPFSPDMGGVSLGAKTTDQTPRRWPRRMPWTSPSSVDQILTVRSWEAEAKREELGESDMALMSLSWALRVYSALEDEDGIFGTFQRLIVRSWEPVKRKGGLCSRALVRSVGFWGGADEGRDIAPIDSAWPVNVAYSW